MALHITYSGSWSCSQTRHYRTTAGITESAAINSGRFFVSATALSLTFDARLLESFMDKERSTFRVMLQHDTDRHERSTAFHTVRGFGHTKALVFRTRL